MFRAMTDHSADLTADLDATGIDVEKAKMSRSEAGRVAANARWGNKGGAPKMIPGGYRTAAGIPVGEQKSNARSKAGMQGARTRAQNKEAAASEGAEQEAMATGGRSTRTPGSIQAEMERAGVPKKTIDAITKNPLGSASAKATASHIKRVKDVNGLSSKQKVKYNEKMDMPTPGMSPDMKHQDAIVHALNPKSPTRAAAGRAAAEARFTSTLDTPKKTGMGPNALARQRASKGGAPTSNSDDAEVKAVQERSRRADVRLRSSGRSIDTGYMVGRSSKRSNY